MQNTVNNKRENFIIIFVLGTLTALGPFSIDMYLPAFPQIAQDLQTTVARVALSLSSYFFGISAGQLFYGPLLDRYGRKGPLTFGLILYMLASLGCVFAPNMDSLIALRFFQAVGSCAASVTSMALVRDLFPVQDSPKIFSFLMLVVGASPMLAPTIGSYISTTFGWHSIFMVLLFMGAAILIAALYILPRGQEPDPEVRLRPWPILRGYWAVAVNKQFHTYALTGSLALSGLFAYVAGSPLVFMEIYGVSAKTFGWIFAGLSVAFIGCAQINRVILHRFGSENIARTALWVQAGMGLFFLVLALGDWLNLPLLVLLLACFLACLGFIMPNTSGLTMAPFKRNAGSAAALLGAFQMTIGSAASLVLGLFNAKSAAPLAAVMGSMPVLALVTLILGRRGIARQVSAETTGFVEH